MDWWRCHHGMPTDPKWRTIAKRAGVPASLVVAVAVAALDRASANATERGRTGEIDTETLADFLDCTEADILAVLDAMRAKGILDGDRFTKWEERQVKREDGSAERARAWREKKKSEPNQTPPNDHDRTRTRPNARERTRTPDKSRGEESREEKKESTPAQHSMAAREIAALADPDGPEALDADAALGNEITDIVRATDPAWAAAGAHCRRWRAQGRTPDHIRAAAHGLRSRLDKTGKPPPNDPAYLDRIIADVASGATKPAHKARDPTWSAFGKCPEVT